MAESILAALLGLKGRKPVPPDLPVVELPESQKKAIQANLGALPIAKELAGQVNQFAFEQTQKMLDAATGGFYTPLTKQLGENLSSRLKGELPPNVVRQATRTAAAKSLGGGYGGGPLAGEKLMELMGLTSLGVQQEAEGALDRWTRTGAAAFGPHQFDVSSMFITPGQELQADETNAINQWNVKWLKEKLDAQPDPLDRALGGFLDFWATTWEGVIQNYIGGVTGAGALGGLGGKGGGVQPTGGFSDSSGFPSQSMYG